MSAQPPKVDKRSYDDIVRQVQDWAEAYTAVALPATRASLAGHLLYDDIAPDATPRLKKGTRLEGEALDALLAHPDLQGTVRVMRWRAAPDQMDAGRALIQIFGRMAAVVIDRLNRVPDKNFLAFLDLIGAQLNPPGPARVPVTFELAAGSPVDARVPLGTQVAAPADETVPQEVIYETDGELTVMRAQLAYVFVRDPDADAYGDYTDIARGSSPSAASFTAFRGAPLIEHSLHIPVADETFRIPQNASLSLHVQTPAIEPLEWSSRDSEGKQHIHKIPPPMRPDSSVVGYDFGQSAAAIGVSEVRGRKARWLRARLANWLKRGMITVTHALTATNIGNVQSASVTGDFFPFGQAGARSRYLYLRVAVYEAVVTAIDRVRLRIVPPSKLTYPVGLVLLWEFWNGAAWEELGRSEGPDRPTSPRFNDTTQAFTRNGQVILLPPANWQARTLYGQPEGYWLRVSIATGDYPQPPVISCPPAYPHFGAITATWRSSAQVLLPQKALFNQAELDLSKDFYPFGEAPKFNDAFYLAHDDAFATPGATVILHIKLTDGVAVTAYDDLRLAWEYWDIKLQRWQTISEIDDNTAKFTKTGSVKFILPEKIGPAEVNGERRPWLRVRILAGTYGQKERYEDKEIGKDQNNKPVTVKVFIPADYKPPSIQALEISYDGAVSTDIKDYWLYNDFQYTQATDKGVDFLPTDDPQPTLYLGFDKPFPNRACQLYFEVEQAAAVSALDQTAEPPRLSWEYMAVGKVWKPLGVRDDTRALTRRGLASFLGPADALESEEFERRAYWLRIRWEGGTYAAIPRLSRILTNTAWASQAITQRDELLGSSNGEKNQTFQTARAPVLSGPRFEVRELLSDSELEQLQLDEGADAVDITYDASGLPEDIWVRWREVPDFYGSGRDDRHYVLDHQTGEVRFGDGLNGKIPPQGRANLRATYRSGGGAAGNRPPRTVAELKTAVPYIDSALNYGAAAGGADTETFDKLRGRGPRILRHRDRAVAPQDFEDLAFLASPQVARARTISAISASDAGQVKLIIVPEGRQERPTPTLELVTRVTDYLLARCDPTLALAVSGPGWLVVNVEADVVPASLEAANTLTPAVAEALRAFLHPLTGGDGQGWAFGRQPQQSDLFRLIESVAGVDHVRRLSIEIVPGVEGEGDATPPMPPPEISLISSGRHRINLVSATDPED
jgi:hypothetical protein